MRFNRMLNVAIVIMPERINPATSMLAVDTMAVTVRGHLVCLFLEQILFVDLLSEAGRETKKVILIR
jgi:hypothetical protein